MSVRLLAPVLLVVLLAGCGSGDDPQPALAPVQLTLDGPQDASVTDDSTVEVHGRVRPPGSEVLVAGDEAGVDSTGDFTALVTLREGANVIDVQAGAPRRRAAMTALRVTRRVPVEVPDLAGLSPEDATKALEDRGLRADVKRSGGLLDDLLPGSLGVCRTDPDAGERVRVGTTVTVEIAKSC